MTPQEMKNEAERILFTTTTASTKLMAEYVCILVDRLEYQKERYQELASHHNEHCICDDIY